MPRAVPELSCASEGIAARNANVRRTGWRRCTANPDFWIRSRFYLKSANSGFSERIFVRAWSIDGRHFATHRPDVRRQLPAMVDAVAQGKREHSRRGGLQKSIEIDNSGGFVRRERGQLLSGGRHVFRIPGGDLFWAGYAFGLFVSFPECSVRHSLDEHDIRGCDVPKQFAGSHAPFRRAVVEMSVGSGGDHFRGGGGFL